MYATQQQMIDRFGEDELIQLTDRANAGVIDPQVLDQALADADATINDYLAGRYNLPLAVVPSSLSRLACDLARYFLYDDHPSEAVRQRYEDAVKFFDAVAKGAIKLGVDAADQAAPVAGTPEVSAPDRIFNHTNLEDY